MVNTFITQADLKLAVKDLDNKRLGKQRVEAKQILDKLYDCKAIIKYYNYNLDEMREAVRKTRKKDDSFSKYEVFKNVFKMYAREEKKLYCRTDKYKYSFEESKESSGNKTWRKVNIGFAYHPMTLSWIGYEDALKYYINLCINEWILRGFSNNMKIYSILIEPKLPWWCTNYITHYSHRSALLRKEKIREEPLWYWNMDHIKENVVNTEWYTLGYVWIPNLSRDVIRRVKNGETVSAKEVCFPQKNDYDS